ncbi:MAG: GatB/YqeY domain-containing protein [Pseudomonadota bacterium]
MSLTDRINDALKRAMKDKDKLRLGTLRLINAVIKDKGIERRGEGLPAEMSDDEILALLGKMTKQRQESLRAYEEGGRVDLAEREKQEISIIAEFLPRQLTEDEVAEAIEAAISASGATSIRDMGKVMGQLKADYTGQMDFGAVGPKVKEKLSA